MYAYFFGIMEIYIIRHTPVLAGKNICYGQSDLPVAETFLQDVQQFKSKLPANFDRVFSSPLQRCVKLANALELDNVLLDNALMEMNFGDWENKNWDDLDQDDLNRWMADFVNVKTPGGESLIELYERVKFFLDNLRLQPHKKVLLISHAGVIRCIWAYLLAIPLQHIFKIPVNYMETFVFNLKVTADLDSIKKMP